MTPLLAITAARAGTNILQNLAENVAARPPEKTGAASEVNRTDFVKAFSQVAASPEVQRAQLLRSEGIRDRAEAEVRVGELAERIAQSPGIREFVGANAAGFDLRFTGGGAVSVRTADGREKTFRVTGEIAELAAKSKSILDAVSVQWPSGGVRTSQTTAGIVHIVPGGGATIR